MGSMIASQGSPGRAPWGPGAKAPWGLPPLYQRQIFVKKGPKEDSKTRAWLDFRAFLRVPDPKNGGFGPRAQNPPKWAPGAHFGPQGGQTPKNGHFWGSEAPRGPLGPWGPGAGPRANPTPCILEATP